MNYVRLMVILSFGFLTGLSGYAQSVVSYFNKFQGFAEKRDIDSALYCAEKLAATNPDLLNFLLHDSFAQKIKSSDSLSSDTTFFSRLTKKMSSGSLPLQRSIYPIFRFLEIRSNLDDSAKIRKSIAGFTVALNRSPEEIGNRIDRYALMLYPLLKSKPEYTILADTLFNKTYRRLEHAVNGIYYQSVDDRTRRNPRAYFRYLMAYSSFVRANEALLRRDNARAEIYLKEASQFSPDDNDRQAKSAYFYESVFLLNGDFVEGFRGKYIDFLLSKGDTTAAIQELTELTLADPGNIELLKTYYQKAPVNQLPFTEYWNQTLNAKLKPAEDFHLTSLDNETFDYKQYKGKWVLIDFWGTWCKPCVEELPRLQKFYNDFALTKQKELVVLTVACHDQESKVTDFMAKNGYKFPVAMADTTVEKLFRINEYPTKVLITPQGRRMKIPFGANWAERVKIYMANQ